jgi:hypothetical protein
VSEKIEVEGVVIPYPVIELMVVEKFVISGTARTKYSAVIVSAPPLV